MSSSAYNIVCYKLGDEISTRVQLTYLGMVTMAVSRAFTLISPTFTSSPKTIELIIAMTFQSILYASFPRVEESLEAILMVIIVGIT